MLRHTLARDDRTERFFGRKTQRGMPSVPDIKEWLYEKFVDDPPTTEEWDWVIENWGLFVMVFRKRRFTESISMGFDDLMGFSVLAAIRALRKWRADGGANKPGFVAHCLLNCLHWSAIKGRAYVCSGGNHPNGVNTNPVLLGDHEPIIRDLSSQEIDPDQTETLDAIRESFDSMKPRWREVLIRFLGLSGPREKASVVAEAMGISKERVCQIVNVGLQKIAHDIGLKDFVVKRNKGNRVVKRAPRGLARMYG